MFVVTLGTQASGSTWLFNVVRALLEGGGGSVFSSYSDHGLDALDQMPLDVENIVLKSHSMDRRLIRIARLAGAKLVISTRDPKDSVVSQRERFGSTLRTALIEISGGFATIESLPADLQVLRFAYEDRFTERPETIASVARFLGLTINELTIRRIFDDLAADAVRLKIATMLANLPSDVVPCHDPITQWHPAHIGDGLTGKWRDRLDPASRAVVSGCLDPLVDGRVWCGEPLRWSAQLFDCNEGKSEQSIAELLCHGEASCISYGPYLRLPQGRWRAKPSIQSDSGELPLLEADIFLPWEARHPARVSSDNDPELVLEFDHFDHFQPVEARLSALEGSRGTVSFSGWQLYYLGRSTIGLNH